ncbi:HugZ family pyridoxamine 5'-phosphate oxidase [Paenibacillus azoreducens]|uniref:Heme utilization protein HutZ n=1 Tax=Paenibacillus azoreducens TaxID=116718 RepID=A0A919YF15_9BACL|nr:pyridoxamine 5'-phosphate oxidase family protein [Paenibacillus azoreducens]GIO47565.1 heme utilization protein HutZ [Paenibacillus azoreducens]
MKTIDIEATKSRYTAFTDSCNTLIISTLDENGFPFAGYAPFVKLDGKLYIYISRISDHYRYVGNNKQILVMMIADESQTPNAFARERARWACTTENLGSEGHENIFEQFNRKFGEKMMNMLRGLDFSLFELTPSAGRYVIGFGQAFDVDLAGDRFEHVVVDKGQGK